MEPLVLLVPRGVSATLYFSNARRRDIQHLEDDLRVTSDTRTGKEASGPRTVDARRKYRKNRAEMVSFKEHRSPLHPS